MRHEINLLKSSATIKEIPSADAGLPIINAPLPAIPTHGGKRIRAGRKAKLKPDDETLDRLRGFGRIHCTSKECAALFEISERGFFDFLDRYPAA
jgi:hypothetical protein